MDTTITIASFPWGNKGETRAKQPSGELSQLWRSDSPASGLTRTMGVNTRRPGRFHHSAKNLLVEQGRQNRAEKLPKTGTVMMAPAK